jgi:microcystin-dependent protein
MSDPFIAEIIMFGGNFAPRGWALCDGQLLPIAQNTALFSILGTTYGGDGRTTFALPDMRSRSPVHPGNGPGLPTFSLGQKSGSGNSALPAHTHEATSTANAVGPAGNSNDAIGNFWADDAATASGTYHTGPASGTMNSGAITTTIASTGVNSASGNYHPNLAVNFIIALVGVFPSRN